VQDSTDSLGVPPLSHRELERHLSDSGDT